jgi:hypothetical protein
MKIGPTPVLWQAASRPRHFVDPPPGDLQKIIVYAAGIPAEAKDPKAAKALPDQAGGTDLELFLRPSGCSPARLLYPESVAKLYAALRTSDSRIQMGGVLNRFACLWINITQLSVKNDSQHIPQEADIAPDQFAAIVPSNLGRRIAAKPVSHRAP